MPRMWLTVAVMRIEISDPPDISRAALGEHTVQGCLSLWTVPAVEGSIQERLNIPSVSSFERSLRRISYMLRSKALHTAAR